MEQIENNSYYHFTDLVPLTKKWSVKTGFIACFTIHLCDSVYSSDILAKSDEQLKQTL